MADVKNDILKACFKIFRKHGIRKMSNEKLASRLGVSTKTLYKYFGNREGLLEEVAFMYFADQYDILENLSEDENAAVQLFDLWKNGVEKEFNVNKAYFHDLHYYYPRVAKKTEGAITQKFNEKFLQIIVRGVEQGDFISDFKPEIAMEGIFALYMSVVRTEQFKGFRLPANGIFFNTLALYIRGFCTFKGLAKLDEYIRENYRSIRQ